MGVDNGSLLPPAFPLMPSPLKGTYRTLSCRKTSWPWLSSTPSLMGLMCSSSVPHTNLCAGSASSWRPPARWVQAGDIVDVIDMLGAGRPGWTCAMDLEGR